MADYPGWIWIMCPRCKKFRMIRKSSYVQMQRTIKLNGPVHCRKCGHKKYSEKMNDNLRERDQAARKIKALTVNGCELFPADGRPEECLDCNKYNECLDVVAETRWPGWRREEK
jgi:hypothetical protein